MAAATQLRNDDLNSVQRVGQEAAASDSNESSDTGTAASLETDSVQKLRCLILLAAVTVVSFVAALNEARSLGQDPHAANQTKNVTEWIWYMQNEASDWILWSLKCAQLLIAIGALAYLNNCASSVAVLPLAKVCVEGAQELALKHESLLLKGVRSNVRLKKDRANYPSKFFLVMFVIFSALATLCAASEMLCAIIDAVDVKMTRLIPAFEIARCLLQGAFVAGQAAFLVRHRRACLQWRLNGVWLASCVIIAINISAWFFYVEREIRELIFLQSRRHESSFPVRPVIEEVSQILSPFLVEYFVMAAILLAAFLSNAGRAGRLLRRGSTPDVTRADIRELLVGAGDEASEQVESSWRSLARYRWKVAASLGLVATALLVSILVKVILRIAGVNIHGGGARSVFNHTLSGLYIAGTVTCCHLLMMFDRVKNPGGSKRHLLDRILLWCGCIAIVLHEFYRCWRCVAELGFGEDGGHDTAAVINDKMPTIVSKLLNIVQSGLQVYVLECILLRDFKLGSSVSRTKAELTLLMAINATEWVISTAAFISFFTDGDRDLMNTVLAVFTLPLQVLFRFHSISCIQEFKHHCSEAANQHPENSQQDAIVESQSPSPREAQNVE